MPPPKNQKKPKAVRLTASSLGEVASADKKRGPNTASLASHPSLQRGYGKPTGDKQSHAPGDDSTGTFTASDVIDKAYREAAPLNVDSREQLPLTAGAANIQELTVEYCVSAGRKLPGDEDHDPLYFDGPVSPLWPIELESK
jgi:hypothetical protein